MIRGWGLVTFAPTRDHLAAIVREVPGFTHLRVQASRSLSGLARARTGAWAAEHLGLANEHRLTFWGPMDSVGDLDDDLLSYVRDVLTRLDQERNKPLLGIILDAETRDARFARQPGGREHYVSKVAPVVRWCNDNGVPVYGPGSTHSDGDDWVNIIRALDDRGVRFTAPSLHFYTDKGWEGSLDRMSRAEAILRFNHGYEWGLLGETGEHGQSRNCFGWTSEDRELQVRRTVRLKRYLDRHDFWTMPFHYQALDEPRQRAGYGVFTHEWRPKPVATFWEDE